MFLILLSYVSAQTNCNRLKHCLDCNYDQTQCYRCEEKYKPQNGECVCDINNDYFYYYGECVLGTRDGCEMDECVYCHTTYKDYCFLCNTSLHFATGSGECYCSDYYNFQADPINGSCECKDGYVLDSLTECAPIKHDKDCYTGCIDCIFEHIYKCIKCKDHFTLEERSCKCEQGYVLDEFENTYDSRCVEIFPKSCPEGCNCDKLNQVCLSCKDNYIPEYYDDKSTIANCIEVVDCSSGSVQGCSKCKKTGECLVCNDGYFLLPDHSACIQREVPLGDCNKIGCVKCQTKERCLACEPDYTYYEGDGYSSCTLKNEKPKKVIYADLSDVNIVPKDKGVIQQDNNNEITLNIQNIDEDKRRPYEYDLNQEEVVNKICINNDNLVDLRINLMKSQDETIIIAPPLNTNQNPYVTLNINNNNANLDLQTSKASIRRAYSGEMEIILTSSNNNIIEVDKLTLNENGYTFYIDKDIHFNEVNIHDDDYSYNYLDFPSSQLQSDKKISISTLYLHQKSSAKIKKRVDVETMKADSKGQVKAEGGISVQRIEINVLASSIERVTWSFIEGEIYGVPESIVINVNPKDTAIHDIDRNFHEIQLAYANNQDFRNNCEKWAKVYNDNPTDAIYNFAHCHDGGVMSLEIIHQEKPTPKKKSNAGLIAGVVVAVVVVVGVVVFLLVYFLVIKKRKQNDNNSSAQEDVEKLEEE